MASLSDRVVMTAEAQQALQAELEHLEQVSRKEIAERIKTAREWGDLKENSEYHDAKNDQAHLETKILRIREQLLNAEVREVATTTDVVGFGNKVVVEDAKSGKELTYELVSPSEASPGDGRLSMDSPVGKALLGARVGQTVKLEKAAPQAEYRVLRSQWEENLKTGLKDQSGNVVGMPIDAAIDKIVSEGLGSKAKQPNGKLNDYAIKMPTASSSGRETEKRLQ